MELPQTARLRAAVADWLNRQEPTVHVNGDLDIYHTEDIDDTGQQLDSSDPSLVDTDGLRLTAYSGGPTSSKRPGISTHCGESHVLASGSTVHSDRTILSVETASNIEGMPF